MSEYGNRGPEQDPEEDPELDEDGLTTEEREIADRLLPEFETPEPVELREYANEVAEFKKLVEQFETKFSLDELNSITELNPATIEHQIRLAEQDLFVDVAKDILKEDQQLAGEIHILNPNAQVKARRLILLRDRAKKDLIPIVSLLNTLKEETNIPKADHDQLKEKYLKLSGAVGIIGRNNIVRH